MEASSGFNKEPFHGLSMLRFGLSQEGLLAPKNGIARYAAADAAAKGLPETRFQPVQ
jgi:hypothetical protein